MNKNIKYIYHPQRVGRLGNILFVLARLFKLSKNTNIQFKLLDNKFLDQYLSNQFNIKFNLYKYMLKLNMLNFYQEYTTKNNINQNDITDIPQSQFYDDQYGVDFTEDDLHNFLLQTIYDSDIMKELLKNKSYYDNKISLHIRTGDYLTNHQYDFNFEKYLKSSIEYLKKNENELFVYTQNIDYVFIKYNNLFQTYFNKINYINNIDDVYDLCELSLYRKKILWNSSYSIWTGFINEIIYPNNYLNICVPDFFIQNINNTKPWQTNPKWKHINVL